MAFGRRAVLALALALPAACSKFRTYEGPPVTSVVVRKGDRRLSLMSGETVLRDYRIALGASPVGPKQFEGDMKTPEGAYVIDRRNPNSQYYLSVGISYPNEADRTYARSVGKDPGGDIFIHGTAGQNRGKGPDWTAGCIAVKDREIEEIYAMVPIGTPIYLYA